MQKQIGIGYESFSELRQREMYYVDKTLFIRDFLKRQSMVYLITRPRRFGKTLMLNTIEEFLDIRKDSRDLFEGLAITVDEDLCKKNMNQYPVLAVSFKGVRAHSFNEAFALLSDTIAEICKNHSYLLESKNVDTDDQRIFRALKAGEASTVEIKKSLLTLTRMMYDHYGKKVVLLIDEYDVPLSGSDEYGYYDQMILTMQNLFEAVLKTNAYLDFAVVTGCLRISKESLFTGVNNLDVYSITSSAFSDMIGFTPDEVRQLLQYYHLEMYYEQMREWYDGYHFANSDIYCPWDVTNHCRALLRDAEAEPQLYWKNTSGNIVLEKFLQKADGTVRSDYQDLLAGKAVCKVISEQLTYRDLTSDVEHIWSLLLLTGYLTTVRMSAAARKKYGMGVNEQLLIIPNREMKELVAEIVQKWFSGADNLEQKQQLARYLFDKNEKAAQDVITDLLFQTISFYDYNENFYHAFVAGILSCSGYRVKSNREQGDGRPDIVLYDDRLHKAVILELKYSKQLKDMEQYCDKALQQITERRYGDSLEEYDEVILYGISFFKKRCMVKLHLV